MRRRRSSALVAGLLLWGFGAAAEGLEAEPAAPAEAALEAPAETDPEAPAETAPAEAGSAETEAVEPSRQAEALDRYDPLYGEPDELEDVETIPDPLEPLNRAIFRFNRGVDWAVLDPITSGYRFLVPAPARRGIQRAFHNLNSPVVFFNLLLQGRGKEAGLTVGRFCANTTLGVVGVFDYAEDVIGWKRTDADFGQTLALYGVPTGPYLVVPLFGPSNTRDAFGNVIDQVMDPLTYFVAPLQLQWALLFGGGQGLSYREANVDALDALRDASVDFYAALRSAYSQAREGVVKEAREARGPLFDGHRNQLGSPVANRKL
jgi:phospholipid-binding lipoprotein MlaA